MINDVVNTPQLIIPLLACIILLLFLLIWNLKLRRRINQDARKHLHHENRFEKIYEAAGDAIVLYDPETEKIVDFNPVLCDIFGYKPEEIYSWGAANPKKQPKDIYEYYIAKSK